MRCITVVLMAAMLLLVPAYAQKKPGEKPESAPAEAPAIPVDPELQKEVDSLGQALKAKVNVVPGKTFDMVGTINPPQLKLLMDVADRAFANFAEICASEGGVAGASTTGSSAGVPAGNTPAEVMFGGRKCMIAVLNNSTQYTQFGNWYHATHAWEVGGAMKGTTYFPIGYPRCAIVTHLKPHDMNSLRNVIAHEVGHICGYRYAYNNNFSPVWFVEGLATCIEGKTTGTTNCFCFSGGYGDAGSKAKGSIANREWSKWKAHVKAQVKGKQDKAISALLPMQLNELTMDEVGKCMAVVDYWMKTDPGKMMRWLALTKKYWPTTPRYEWEGAKGEAQKKALAEVFKMEWTDLDAAVRKHAQANY